MNKVIYIPLLMLVSLLSTTVSAEHYILSNRSVDMEELTQYQVKAIFLGRMHQWENGEVLSPCYVLPGKDSIDAFFIETVKKDYSRFIRYWNKRLFSGAGSPPVKVKDMAGLFDYLANTSGAVCMVKKHPVTLPETVRIVTVLY